MNFLSDEFISRLTRSHQFNVILKGNALSEYPQLLIVENRAL